MLQYGALFFPNKHKNLLKNPCFFHLPCSCCHLLIMRPSNKKRLSEQHPWYADDSDDDKKALKLSLACVQVRVAVGFGLVASEQNHVDEGDEDGRGTTFRQHECGWVRVGIIPIVGEQKNMTYLLLLKFKRLRRSEPDLHVG
jgi:hypothetical protein